MNTIFLCWKAYSINLSKLRVALKALLSNNYDGLVASPEGLTVIFFADASQADSDALTTYWDAVTINTFAPTAQEIIALKISAAIQFGNQIIVDATTTNVLQGISQAGKTKEVSDFLADLGRYLKEGSMYAAIDEIDRLVALGIPEDITTWVTLAKLAAVKLKIQTFLGIAP